MSWKRKPKAIVDDGTEVIRYEAEDMPDVAVESRKHVTEHANGDGTWTYTTYFVIWPDGSESEYWTLRDAKRAAEGRRG